MKNNENEINMGLSSSGTRLLVLSKFHVYSPVAIIFHYSRNNDATISMPMMHIN